MYQLKAMEGHSGPECTASPGPSFNIHIEQLPDDGPQLQVPKVIIEPSGQSRFASSVIKILSLQRFYKKNERRSRDSFLEKYAYLPTNDGWDWRQTILRRSASAAPQVQSPSSEATSSSFDAKDVRIEANGRQNISFRFVFDPSGSTYFLWLLIVVLGVLYNYWMLIFRLAFFSLKDDHLTAFLVLDYVFYFIFLLDILVQLRTGFCVDGCIMTDSIQLAKHYAKSVGFFLDLLAILPVDLFYFEVGPKPFLRFGRLLKINRFFLFCDRAEFYTERPKLFNLFKQVHYLVLIIHWVACLFFMISHQKGFGTDGWVHPRLEDQWAHVSLQYVYCLYRSIVSMTTVGTGVYIGAPQTTTTIGFVIFTYLCGVLIFASIVGNVGDMIVHMRRSREQYLRKLDGMKAYIAANQLPLNIQRRVVQWYDYLWTNKKDMNEQELFQQLNDNFKAEIAIHVNLDMLKKVKMFEKCDPGFLRELVLMLKPLLCSPGDYVCRQDDIGKEMYFVKKGQLEVLDEKGTVLATLSAGRHFGEISILDMEGIGNRRTASVRSVGFTDLFRLAKADLEDVLQHYSESREQLYRIARHTFQKQQRERNGENECDENTDYNSPRESSSNLEMDPRMWLTADKETLRRRLSDIEAKNDVQMLANKFKREHGLTVNPRDTVAVFARLAREEWSDEEARIMVKEFVLRRRNSTKKAKQQTSSHESVIQTKLPRQMDKQHRHCKMTNSPPQSDVETSTDITSDLSRHKYHRKFFGRTRARTATSQPGFPGSVDTPLLTFNLKEDYDPFQHSLLTGRRGTSLREHRPQHKPLALYSRLSRSNEFSVSTGLKSRESCLTGLGVFDTQGLDMELTPRISSSTNVEIEPARSFSERMGNDREGLCEKSTKDEVILNTSRSTSHHNVSFSPDVHSPYEERLSSNTFIDGKEGHEADIPEEKKSKENVAQGNEMQHLDGVKASLRSKEEGCRTTTI